MKKLKKILAEILGLKEEEITDETSPDDVETWDSYNALLMVSEIENNFKVKFSMDEIISVKSVKDIKNILKKHGVKKI